jgi:hypothetical protein
MEITTSFGSKFTILDDQYLVFGDRKVSLKKIEKVGDYKFDEVEIKTSKEIRIISIIVAILSLLGVIYFIYNPYISYKGLYSFDGRSLEQINLWPQILLSFLFVASLIGVIIFNNKIKEINNIDFNSNQTPLTIDVIIRENSNPDNSEIERYEICKGQFKELCEIRKTLLRKIENQKIS